MHQNLLHDLHTSAGATLRPADEPRPLLTYGDVPAEYEAARSNCVLFDETDRGLLRASGDDAREFLHRLLANDVLPLATDAGNRNLLLTSKGKVLFDVLLSLTAEGDYVISCEPGDVGRLREALDMYLFTEDVALEDESADYAPLALFGPRAADLVQSVLEVDVPSESCATAHGRFGEHAATVTHVPLLGADGLRVDAGPEAAPELWRAFVAAGAQPAGRVVADILRVERAAGLAHQDITDDVYPQEARLEDAFSLTKGCYIGQEVVAKIDTYGGLNKRLQALRVSHDDPVPAGTRLFRHDPEKDEWRDLGVVTSWAYSFEDDTGHVLAYLKRRHQDPGCTFRLGEGPGEAVVLDR